MTTGLRLQLHAFGNHEIPDGATNGPMAEESKDEVSH
jgi:hypothetical protein